MDISGQKQGYNLRFISGLDYFSTNNLYALLTFTWVILKFVQPHLFCFLEVWKILQKRKWQPTPVLLPGKFHGQRSLVGYSLWGHRVGYDLGTSLSFTFISFFKMSFQIYFLSVMFNLTLFWKKKYIQQVCVPLIWMVFFKINVWVN